MLFQKITSKEILGLPPGYYLKRGPPRMTTMTMNQFAHKLYLYLIAIFLATFVWSVNVNKEEKQSSLI